MITSVWILCALSGAPQLEAQGTNSLAFQRWGYDPVRERVFGDAQVWDAKTGYLDKPLANVKDVLPSADGRVYLITNKDGTKEIRDGATQRVLWKVDDSFKQRFQRIKELSPDGKLLLLGDKDASQVQLHNVEKKGKYGSFRGPKEVTVARFDPSGRAMILTGYGRYVAIVDVSGMRKRFQITAPAEIGMPTSADMDDLAGVFCVAFRESGKIIIGDTKTGKTKRTLKPPREWKYTGCAFGARAGELVTLRTISTPSRAGTVLETQTLTGKVLGQYAFSGVAYHGLQSHADRTILTINAGDSVLAWNTKHRRPLFHVGQRAPHIIAASFSDDSKRMALTADERVYVFDLEGLHVQKIIDLKEAIGSTGHAAGWSADGQLVVLSPWTAVLIHPQSERVTTLLKASKDRTLAGGTVSMDGRKFVVTVKDKAKKHNSKDKHALLQLDLPSGKTVSTHTMSTFNGRNAVSKDGKMVAVVDKGKMTLFRADRSHPTTTLVKGTVPFGSTPFFTWDATSLVYGPVVNVGAAEGAKGAPIGHRFAPFDGGWVVAKAGNQGLIEVRSSPTGHATKTISNGFQTNKLQVSPNGKFVVAGDLHGRIIIANALTGKFIRLTVRGSDWLAYTPDGYFAGSRSAGRLAAFRSGGVAYPIDQFARTRNRPDKVLAHLGLGSAALIDHYSGWHARRLARLGIRDSALVAPPKAAIRNSRSEGDTATLTVECKKTSRPVARYQIYVNDVALRGPSGEAYDKPAEATVTLNDGQNKIEASCLDDSGGESLREVVSFAFASASKPDMYFLGFGVSKYKDKALNLQYAAQDAKDIANALKKAGRNGFGKVHVKTFFDAQVTRTVFTDAQTFVEPAKPDDLVVVFIAGHGMHETGKAGGYYFLTHEADPDSLSTTAAAFEDIESLLYATKSRRKLFLMDTCESGEDNATLIAPMVTLARGSLSRGLKRKKPMKAASATPASRTLALGDGVRYRNRYIYNDLLRRSGAVVFSSSSGGELSYESAKLKNGYFTEGLLRALAKRKGGDVDGDRRVSVRELEDYVRAFVRKESGGLQNPTIDRDNIFVDIALPVQ